MLIVKNLVVTTQNKEVIKGLNLKVKSGEIHAIMGPNGAGKTSLAMVLAGHPGYKFDPDQIGTKFEIDGENIFKLKPEERAKYGLFVAFQQPIEVTGVSVLAFLRTAYKALHPKEAMPLSEFKKKVADALLVVGLEESFMQRSLNEGFSGGEKKRAEVVQLLVLSPKFAILDEIDSGLDVDSLRIVAQALKKHVTKTGMGMIVITHYSRILHYLKPDVVSILIDGEIKKSDGLRLVKTIEKRGYAAV